MNKSKKKTTTITKNKETKNIFLNNSKNNIIYLTMTIMIIHFISLMLCLLTRASNTAIIINTVYVLLSAIFIFLLTKRWKFTPLYGYIVFSTLAIISVFFLNILSIILCIIVILCLNKYFKSVKIKCNTTDL